MKQGPIIRRIPPGDNRERLVCEDCDFVLYENPKIVVGTVSSWDGMVLLVKRSIEPRRGYWTLPAGFMEEGETSAEGARRETLEEAGAEVDIDGLLAVYDVVRVSQVQLFYRAALRSPDLAPGIESLAAGLFPWDDIPWGELAFPTVEWALHHWHAVRGKEHFRVFGNPDGETGSLLAFVGGQRSGG